MIVVKYLKDGRMGGKMGLVISSILIIIVSICKYCSYSLLIIVFQIKFTNSCFNVTFLVFPSIINAF